MKLRLPQHGRDHRPGGSDPITGVLAFNRDNEGGWLYAQTNDSFDLDLLPDPLAVGGTWGMVLEDGSDAGMLLGSTGQVLIKGRDGGVALESNGGGISRSSDGGGINDDTGGGGYQLRTAQGTIELDSHTGAAHGNLITIDAGDNEVDVLGDTVNIDNMVFVDRAADSVEVKGDGGGVVLRSGAGGVFPLPGIAARSVGMYAGDASNLGVVALGAYDSAGHYSVVSAAEATYVSPPGSGLTFKGVTVQITTGQTFSVVDHAGYELFRCDESGNLHGLTGKALVFDL